MGDVIVEWEATVKRAFSFAVWSIKLGNDLLRMKGSEVVDLSGEVFTGEAIWASSFEVALDSGGFKLRIAIESIMFCLWIGKPFWNVWYFGVFLVRLKSRIVVETVACYLGCMLIYSSEIWLIVLSIGEILYLSGSLMVKTLAAGITSVVKWGRIPIGYTNSVCLMALGLSSRMVVGMTIGIGSRINDSKETSLIAYVMPMIVAIFLAFSYFFFRDTCLVLILLRGTAIKVLVLYAIDGASSLQLGSCERSWSLTATGDLLRFTLNSVNRVLSTT